MYQLLITTPFGELGSQHFTEEQMDVIKSEYLKNIENLSFFSVLLENGEKMYMSKEMIGSSVFIVRKIS